MLGKQDLFDAGQDARDLVVLIHGNAGSPNDLLAIREYAVRPAIGTADIFIPRLPYARLLCSMRMRDIVASVSKQIDELWQRKKSSGQPYERVIVLGYSFGSQPARAVLLHAWGWDDVSLATEAPPPTTMPQPRYEWAPAMSRIVLLSGLNRGVSFESPMAGKARRYWTFVTALNAFWPINEPTIFSIRRGSPFLTELRLKWLDLWSRLGQEAPVVVQLLGTKDDLIDPADNLDLYAGKDFYYIEVPFTGHSDILQVSDDRGDQQRRSVARDRCAAIKLAVAGDLEALKRSAIPKLWLGDPTDLEESDEVDDVVFIMHGIRDYGFWTQKIGRQIRLCAEENGSEVRVVNPTYGYFPILSFALPWIRQRKVDWLMDKYVEVRKCYPKADISYVGHSNGTYLLARALREYPSARFKNVVFAGSVVRADYKWSDVGRKRLNALLNFVATADWVVALFPKGLQPLRLFDLGSGGHDGFRDTSPINVRFVTGSHDAGITENHWKEIANFIIKGTPPATKIDKVSYSKRRRLAIVLLGMISTLVLLAALVAMLGIGTFLLSASLLGEPGPNFTGTIGNWLVEHPVATFALLVAYVGFLRFLFTRF